jgi:hypothetical protein
MGIPRVNVLDYGALGRKFIEWTTSPETRPKDLTELAAQLDGIIGPLPDYIKSLMFVQATKDVLLIRLPPADLVEDTRTALSHGGVYGMPTNLKTFYTDLVHSNFYADQTKQAERQLSFEFRVGDYLIAHCW